MKYPDPQFIKSFLNEKYEKYNTPVFIETDPVQIPHMFTRLEDIEISAFLTATIAWGKREMIIKNAKQLCLFMDDAPYDFIINAVPKDFERFRKFKHRTFNGDDCVFFLKALQRIYRMHKNLKSTFEPLYIKNQNIEDSISDFRSVFFQTQHLQRSEKHFSNIVKNSAAKRINLFLRWMVRKDKSKIDFGLWEKIPASALYLPLDVHTGNVTRKLGLLQRKQNDWKAVQEVTAYLKILDANDPVKYDYALFGLGIFEKF